MLVPNGSGVNESGGSGERHGILRDLLRELERHPIVTTARGYPPSLFTEIRARVAPERWGYPVDDATLQVTWYPGDRPQFAFHYNDATGFDCGWHCEPNPHVDGWLHYQERERDDEDYSYKPISFEAETPTTLVWEILERLQERLEERA
jgi:hypothetical protein